jgi:hypothetical protein
MARVELYTTVHKGIRSALFEATAAVARTEFADAGEAASAGAAVRRTLAFLDEHAEHEDAVVMPELARICPELFAELTAEHARTHGLQREIEALAARLDGASEAERVALGVRLHERLARLVAEHLRHMAREETEGQRVLAANRSDAELRALHDRIVGRIAPARVPDWLALILPSAALSERAAILADLRAALPPPVFSDVLGPARAALGPSGWERALAAAAP